jgi:hypothetical protein
MGHKLENRNERFLIKDAYLVFYDETEKEVHILHIWDS